MPHSIFGGDELSPGLYGDHEILTFMAQEASKGPPKEVFWRMQEENEPFYHAMSEYAGTAIGDDPLARYEDEDEQDSGEDEADIYDYESFFIPEEGAALEKSFDAMEDGDVKQGLSDIGDIVSSAWDWASDLGSSLLDLGGDIFEGLGEAPIPMSAEAAGPIPDWAGMGLEEDIFRDIGPFTPTYPVATPMPVDDGPSFDDIYGDIGAQDTEASMLPPLGDIGSNMPFLSVGGLTQASMFPGDLGDTDRILDEERPPTMSEGNYDMLGRLIEPTYLADQRELFIELDKAYGSRNPMGMIRDLINAGITYSDIEAWMESPNWSGIEDYNFQAGLAREFGIQPPDELPLRSIATDGIPTTDGVIDTNPFAFLSDSDDPMTPPGLEGTGEVVTTGGAITTTGDPLKDIVEEGPDATPGDYDVTTANLRARFFDTMYKQPGVGQASRTELNTLLYQTRLLFFLEQGDTAWQNFKDDDAPAMEGNYETYLNEYLARPYAQRLNPTGDKDFYTLLREVSEIYTKSKVSPDWQDKDAAAWTQEEKNKKLWVEGLFGDGYEDNRDSLVKLGLTRGGMGRFSQQIHKAAQDQMDYFRDIGWTEERIFDYMTEGMKKSEAAPQPPGLGDFEPSEDILREEEEIKKLMAEAEEKQEPLGLEYTGKNYMDALAKQDYSWAGVDEFGMPGEGEQTTIVPAIPQLSITPPVIQTGVKEIPKTAMLPRTRTVAKKDYQHTSQWYDLIIKDKQGKQIGKHRGKITPWDFQRGGYQKAGWKLSPNQGPLV